MVRAVAKRKEKAEAADTSDVKKNPYGDGSAKLNPEVVWKLQMVARFRNVSLWELVKPVLGPFAEAEYTAMLAEAVKREQARKSADEMPPGR